ncbi:HpcH/HpaI aldolase family protein [Arenibaculum sp.]|uniref:HpcH/HpaI aldolase family protein n=1 Tax=Arenibaculum sp. TaxID=2865862 RepID=UPI002E135C51|nr:aldolase/citrate lyase family protein [Arenibaculum sp.]
MKNPMKASIAAGRAALGYLATIPSVGAVQALAGAGADFVLIDMEHAPIGPETAAALIAATNGTGTAPLVRVPGPRSGFVKPALDGGAYGIAFAQVATAADAEAGVEVSRYAPRGRRGYGPARAALRWGLSVPDYVASADGELLNIVLVESPEGIAALDDILRVDGIDVVVVARSDLSAALGIPGRFDDPGLRRLVAEAEAKILAHGGVALGGNARDPEEAKAMIRAGYRLLVLGSDGGLVQRTAAAELSAVRS